MFNMDTDDIQCKKCGKIFSTPPEKLEDIEISLDDVDLSPESLMKEIEKEQSPRKNVSAGIYSGPLDFEEEEKLRRKRIEEMKKKILSEEDDF